MIKNVWSQHIILKNCFLPIFIRIPFFRAIYFKFGQYKDVQIYESTKYTKWPYRKCLFKNCTIFKHQVTSLWSWANFHIFFTLGVYISENIIFKITQIKEYKVTIINYLWIKIHGSKIKIDAFCDVANIQIFSKSIKICQYSMA